MKLENWILRELTNTRGGTSINWGLYKIIKRIEKQLNKLRKI